MNLLNFPLYNHPTKSKIPATSICEASSCFSTSFIVQDAHCWQIPWLLAPTDVAVRLSSVRRFRSSGDAGNSPEHRDIDPTFSEIKGFWWKSWNFDRSTKILMNLMNLINTSWTCLECPLAGQCMKTIEKVKQYGPHPSQTWTCHSGHRHEFKLYNH